MTEGSIDRPSTSGPLPAEGFPSNPVALVRWQAEVNSVLPPAQEIEALERIIPQAGERLLRLVEREAEHRQGLEKRIVAADNFRANLGLMAGIVMAVGVSTASLTAIFQGKQIGGIVGIGATAALISAAFRVKKVS
jgi:uncharacterized membrane protein